jgi:hypothetical protein
MFGRRKNKDTGPAIAEFWRWWADARHSVGAAIDDGTVAALAGEISRRVASIHKGLQWELSQGTRAQHALVVAAAGNAALRATVARWLAAAPAPDAVFEYLGSRPSDDAVFTSRMQIAGHELDLSELRFAYSTDEDAHDLDVSVFHPGFRELPESARLQVTFLALDWALGEEQVEMWVGRVEAQQVESPGLRPYGDLRAAVADLAAKHAEPRYAMLGGERPGGRPMMAMVQVPLKSVRWPRFDAHIAVTARFPAQPNGLPTDESLAHLRDLEDRVEAVLPPDGEVVAHETADGVRTLHVYADGTTPAVDAVSAVATSFGPLRTAVSVTHDPGFERVAHLRP